MIVTIPFKLWGKFTGITIWPFIFVSKGKATDTLINHERIHLRQQLECLLIAFYIIYVFDFLRLLIRNKSWMYAYKYICFEREAYRNEDDFKYLGSRKAYAWRRIFK